MCGTLLYDVNPEIEFDGSGADPVVAAFIEGHVRKAIETLCCTHDFPGRVSFRVDGAQVRVHSACCPLFLQAVKDAVADALA
jgi:hypothetical protein